MSDDFWFILKSQPGMGVLIVDSEGVVLFCNPQARQIYYGGGLNPVGRSIEEIEGREFASERMSVIRQVIDQKKPMLISHIRGGRYTEAMIWPMEPTDSARSRILAITRQPAVHEDHDHQYEEFRSAFVDLGPLDVLTPRELEVLALIGHGVPLKSVASQLGIAQRTVERYRTDIARKLHVNSIAEIAGIVQLAGLEVGDALSPRLHRWKDAGRS
ncbi:MAG: LuxR C-terminal-related transcriptional regulator [Planctomycetaceae bacterium]